MRQPRQLRLTAGALGLLAVFTAASMAQQVEPRVEKLDNGMQLILVERHEEPTVACCIIFDVGSVNDPAGLSGIAHMFEHMMFKGTHVINTTDWASEEPILEQQDKLRAKMIDEMQRMRLMKRLGKITDVLDPSQWTPEYVALKKDWDALVAEHSKYVKNTELDKIYNQNGGVGLNAGTAEDMTLYFVQLPSNKLELFFWLESDRLANPVMREFYVERDNVREERRLRTESTPTGRFDEAFNAMFWQSHPYGVPVLGWASEVESITRDDVENFFDKYYAPNNATLVMVGDFNSDDAVSMAKKYFGQLKKGVKPDQVVTEEPRPIAERRFYAKVESNPIVTIRFHGVAMGHKDEAALDIAGELLSGKTGRLYKRLVEQEDAVIGTPFASNSSRKYAGSFEIQAVVKEGHTLQEVEDLLIDEVNKLANGEITEHEMEKVKNQTLAASIQRLRSNMGLMLQLAVYETWDDWTYINEHPKRMLAATADDVQRVVKEYLDPETRTVAWYETKGDAAKPAGDEDPELAALLAGLPEDAQPQIKMVITQIRNAQDVSKLEQAVPMYEQMAASGKLSDEEKKVMDYMLKTIRTRIDELKAQQDDQADGGEEKGGE